jgi:phosphoserine phosphatase RsbU/P
MSLSLSDKENVPNSDARLFVLGVDDDPVFRRFLEFALAASGYRVIVVPDVPSARASLESLGPDAFACVLVDYAMPGEDGIDLLRWLKGHCPTLSTVMITAMGEKRLVEKTLREGVTEFLDKPIRPAEICRAVAAASARTAQRRSQAELRKQAKQAARHTKTMLESMLAQSDIPLECRFHPRYDCGGDFLTYHRLPSGDDLFVITDVAGHDLASTGQSSYLHGILKGFLMSGKPLEKVLLDYNRFLLSGPTSEVYSVCVNSLQFNRETGCMLALNFGGPPPLFVDWQGWVETMGVRASSPLGWFEDARPTVARVGIPPGPVWMWTDGLEQLAEDLKATPAAVAYALLLAREDEYPEWLAQAGDDVLVARIWPGVSGRSASSAYFHPLIADEYGSEMTADIDSLQGLWERSLKLALPGLSRSTVHDALLCSREAVLNSLKHGCDAYGKARFQVLYDPSAELLRVRVSDCGTGYDFDVEQHAKEDLREPVSGHRGLLLIHSLASYVSTSRNGAEVTMDFSARSQAPSEFKDHEVKFPCRQSVHI